MTTADFTIAHEMRRLREENDDLRARLAEAERIVSGRDKITTIDRLGITGQARAIVCALAAQSPGFVSTDRLLDICRIDCDSGHAQVRQIVDRLRDKLRGLMAMEGKHPPTRLQIIRGQQGIGYAIPSDVAAWLLRTNASGGSDVSRTS